MPSLHSVTNVWPAEKGNTIEAQKRDKLNWYSRSSCLTLLTCSVLPTSPLLVILRFICQRRSAGGRDTAQMMLVLGMGSLAWQHKKRSESCIFSDIELSLISSRDGSLKGNWQSSAPTTPTLVDKIWINSLCIPGQLGWPFAPSPCHQSESLIIFGSLLAIRTNEEGYRKSGILRTGRVQHIPPHCQHAKRVALFISLFRQFIHSGASIRPFIHGPPNSHVRGVTLI